jgi:signal transduction histidine kinase
MMLLILTAIGFMWAVQILLFEQNYVNATIRETESRLSEITDELKTSDLFHNESLLSYAGKSVRGKLFLFNQEGQVLFAYNNGHPMSTEEAVILEFVQGLQKTPKYISAMEQGVQWGSTLRFGDRYLSYEIGMPVIWDGEKALLYMIQPMEEVYLVQAFNRRQLIVLSIALTVISGGIAWFLSRRFVNPIRVIKYAVDNLTRGNLEARPGLGLRDELGRLSDSVAELGRALQRVDVLRKEVIANVSHELRAPLSLIAGYAEMVRDVSWNNDEIRNENLNLIISEARRMNDMVGDILDFSQLQSGYVQINKAEYNLYEIIESEARVYDRAAKDFDIRIVFESESKEIPVCVDALKLSRVMRNLLNNAVNHTEDDETIIVSVHENGSKLKVAVSNPGKPIPEEKLKMIWERYYSSQHQGSRKQGTGLGLSIVSAILDAHGFAYGVECKNGFNSFWFEIEV